MCGRYSITTAPEAMRRLFNFEDVPNLPPRWNVAPTQAAPVVRETDGVRRLDQLRWGLVPSWSKDMSGAARMINARAETVAEKPAFRAAFRQRRCLVPADGFYEWQPRGREKQPFRVTLRDAAPFAFAGLWERWTRPEDGEVVETYCIITTEAAASIAHIHHRMPVMLDPGDFAAWLDGPFDRLAALLRPMADARLESHEVSPRVGNVRNDDAGLIEPVAGQGMLL
jgi:putative SOS response-associated peptidase YedK